MARWAASVAALTFVAGCKLLSNDDDPEPAPAAQTAPAAPATMNAASGQATGIPECDALLVAFECYLKNSGVPSYELSIQQMRESFRQSSGSAGERQKTAASCKLQMNAQQANFARVGCASVAAAPGGLGAPGGSGNLR